MQLFLFTFHFFYYISFHCFEFCYYNFPATYWSALLITKLYLWSQGNGGSLELPTSSSSHRENPKQQLEKRYCPSTNNNDILSSLRPLLTNKVSWVCTIAWALSSQFLLFQMPTCLYSCNRGRSLSAPQIITLSSWWKSGDRREM